MPDGNPDQRRIERQRDQRADSNPEVFPAVRHRDDRDPARVVAHDGAELGAQSPSPDESAVVDAERATAVAHEHIGLAVGGQQWVEADADMLGPLRPAGDLLRGSCTRRSPFGCSSISSSKNVSSSSRE